MKTFREKEPATEKTRIEVKLALSNLLKSSWLQRGACVTKKSISLVLFEKAWRVCSEINSWFFLEKKAQIAR